MIDRVVVGAGPAGLATGRRDAVPRPGVPKAGTPSGWFHRAGRTRCSGPRHPTRTYRRRRSSSTLSSSLLPARSAKASVSPAWDRSCADRGADVRCWPPAGSVGCRPGTEAATPSSGSTKPGSSTRDRQTRPTRDDAGPSADPCPGRGLSLQALAHAGATFTGRLVAVDDRRVFFDDSARANVAAGDAFAARVASMIDKLIERVGRQAPPSPIPPPKRRSTWTPGRWT
jgi:hypothetical protein